MYAFHERGEEFHCVSLQLPPDHFVVRSMLHIYKKNPYFFGKCRSSSRHFVKIVDKDVYHEQSKSIIFKVMHSTYDQMFDVSKNKSPK